MPSVRYYNQTAPFWDFVASVEQQGLNHPLFAGQNRGEGRGEGAEGSDPFEGHWGPWGRFQHGFFGSPRGGHRGHHHGNRHPHGPPPPGPPPPDYEGGDMPPPPPPHDGSGTPPPPPGPHEHPGSPSHPHGPPPFAFRGCSGRRGRHMGRGGFGGFGGPFGLAALANLFQPENQNAEGSGEKTAKESEDFEPEADVFDTETAFVIHISLPGAKKEDVGVNWDAEKSEISIAGVVYRPGDEDLLKTLALDERKVGAFERKIRLGSRANPAQVDIDGISAKLEDGILKVTVPKEDKEWHEIKKVDVE